MAPDLSTPHAANALPAPNGGCFRCYDRKIDWQIGSDFAKIQMPLHAMINGVVKSKHLTPMSARLTGNAVLALSAPVPMADLMDTEDALDTLDFVAPKMAARAEKRKKEEEEHAAMEERLAKRARGQEKSGEERL